MSVEIDGTTIRTFVGDSCTIVFTGLLEGMVIYLGVRDMRTNEPVFDEIKSVVDKEGEVTFTIPPEYTNKFKVKPQEMMASYYYGIKQVDEEAGEENTILLGGKPVFGNNYILKAYIKKVEGVIENE